MASNQPGYDLHISSNTTTSVGTSARLERIVINKKGATSNVATVYNGPAADSDVKAIIDTTASLGTLEYGVDCPNGIYVVTATGTAADLTVVYTQ